MWLAPRAPRAERREAGLALGRLSRREGSASFTGSPWADGGGGGGAEPDPAVLAYKLPADFRWKDSTE
ncbi:MAG: hypothetical protein ACRD1B_11875, partial [Thermoanaerobaculia bacterium]